MSIGDILCTDGSIVSREAFPSSGRTAQGIVFYVDDTDTHGWAISLDSQGASIQWCSENNVSEGSYYYHLHKLREHLLQSAALSSSVQATPADTAEFVRVPFTLGPQPGQGPALRVRRGSTVIEVSNDASEGILSLMREVLCHAE